MAKLDRKEYKESIQDLEEAIVIASQSLEISRYPLGILYYQLGYTYNLIDEFDKAFECLRKSHKILLKETGQYSIDLADNYAELGFSRSGVYDYESSIVYFQRAINIYLELDIKSKRPLAFLYSNLGMEYRRTGRYEKSSECFQEAISIYEKDKKEKEIVLRLKADIYLNKSEFTKAIDCRKEVLNLRLKKFKPNSSEIVRCYMNLGDVYIKMGDEKNALAHYEKVINYRKEKNIPDYSMVEIYTGLSRTNKFRKDYEKAIEYIKKSLTLAEEKKDYTQAELIDFHTEIGYLYKKNNDTENAIKYYENAHVMVLKLPEEDRSISLEIYYELAFLYEKKKNRTKSNYFFKKLIQIYDTDLWQDIPYLANSHSTFGKVWLARKNYDKAILFLEKAQSLHLKSITKKEVRAVAATASNYLNLSKAFCFKKEREKALASLVAGISTFLSYLSEDESELFKTWDEYKENYSQKNKELYSPREINYYLYYYKELRINFVDSFFENLKIISIQKSDYKSIIRLFEKHSKDKPDHYNWCQKRILALQELQMLPIKSGKPSSRRKL